MLTKLQAVILAARKVWAIKAMISWRKKTAPANTGQIETQLAEMRAMIELGTENLTLAEPADVPRISRLLAGGGTTRPGCGSNCGRPSA